MWAQNVMIQACTSVILRICVVPHEHKITIDVIWNNKVIIIRYCSYTMSLSNNNIMHVAIIQAHVVMHIIYKVFNLALTQSHKANTRSLTHKK